MLYGQAEPCNFHTRTQTFMSKGFMRRLDCCYPVDEEVLVNFCLHSIIDEYLVFLNNLPFSSFSKLMEAAKQRNEYLKRTLLPSILHVFLNVVKQFPRKRPLWSQSKRSKRQGLLIRRSLPTGRRRRHMQFFHNSPVMSKTQLFFMLMCITFHLEGTGEMLNYYPFHRGMDILWSSICPSK